jgi:hypothetical protein
MGIMNETERGKETERVCVGEYVSVGEKERFEMNPTYGFQKSRMPM